MNPVYLLGIVQQANQLRRDIAHAVRSSERPLTPEMQNDTRQAVDALLQLVFTIYSESEHVLITEHAEPIEPYTGLPHDSPVSFTAF